VFESFQIPYSALERQHEELIQAASDAGAAVIVRGGVARGEPGAGLGNKDRWASWEAAGLDDLLEEGETRTGFLLRFTNAHPGMNTNIVGTMNVDHLKENIAAAYRGCRPTPTSRPKGAWTARRPIGEWRLASCPGRRRHRRSGR
jgi:aryl-alcohol dehydrogenase-like predicted oxidoreductase